MASVEIGKKRLVITEQSLDYVFAVPPCTLWPSFSRYELYIKKEKDGLTKCQRPVFWKPKICLRTNLRGANTISPLPEKKQHLEDLLWIKPHELSCWSCDITDLHLRRSTFWRVRSFQFIRKWNLKFSKSFRKKNTLSDLFVFCKIVTAPWHVK